MRALSLAALTLALPASLCLGAVEAAGTPQAGGYLSDELGKLDSGAAASAPAAAPVSAPSLLPTLLNVAFSLAFVVGLVFLAYWLLLKWRDRQGISAGPKAGLIKVLERQYIDVRHSVAVVEVGEEILTLGLGEDVRLLVRTTDPESVERMRQQAPLPASVMGFKEQLERVGMRLRKEEWGQAKQALRTQADEMRALKERMGRPRGEGR
jgi:flagellar protein FliO/FliZ